MHGDCNHGPTRSFGQPFCFKPFVALISMFHFPPHTFSVGGEGLSTHYTLISWSHRPFVDYFDSDGKIIEHFPPFSSDFCVCDRFRRYIHIGVVPMDAWRSNREGLFVCIELCEIHSLIFSITKYFLYDTGDFSF